MKKYAAIYRNAVSLGLVQIANFIIPILLIPYVVRALGIDAYGRAAYAQNIVSYLTVLINFGFEYSATRDVAVHRNDIRRISATFWSVMAVKFFLFLLSMAILTLLLLTVSRLQRDVCLYLYAFVINIGYVLFPTWFFQGKEEMGRMSLFNFLIKFLAALMIVFLVRSSSDYRLYILILSLSYIVVGVGAFLYVIRHYHIVWIHPTLSMANCGKSLPIFFNMLFGTFYSTFGLTYLGFGRTDAELGIYSGVYKMIIAVIMVVNVPISISLYPAISRKFAVSKQEGLFLFKRSLFVVSLVALLVSLLTYFLAPIGVSLFLGHTFADSIQLLRMMAILPFLVIVASMFTIQGLYAFQLERFAPYMGFVLSLLCLLVTVVLTPKYGMYGAACGYIVAEIGEICCSAYLVNRAIKKGD